MSSNIQGNLKIMSLPDVLQWISLAQKSGSLIFKRKKEKKVLFFRKGSIIGANSNNPKDKIGEILVRTEKVPQEELDAGLRKQKETGELIGDVFLGKGLLTTKDFVAALECQATEIIYDLFSWKEGEFIFQEKLPKARTIPISIKVDFILMEGMRRIDEWQRIKETFPTLDTILDWKEEITDEKVGDEEGSIRKLINGKNTILDICDQSPMNDFETCNILYTLLKDGKILKLGTRGAHEIMDDDDIKRLLSRGKAFYQKGRLGDAIPFFERILKLNPDAKEADRFLSRSITAVQNELLKSLGSPNALLEIDKGFRIEEARDLTAAEGFVLSRIDGRSTAKEVTFISGLSQTEACITLNRLLEKGIITAGRDKEEVSARKAAGTDREFLDPKKKRMTLDLAEVSLSEIFLDLIKQRQAGILQLISSPMDIRVYFQEGAIVYASSNMDSDRCGSIMQRKGKISEQELESVKKMSEKEGILQGNALVKLGIISPNDLIWLTKTKTEEILYSLFGWRKGKARFFEGDLDHLDIIHLKLIPGRIILEGTWRYFEEEEIIGIFGSSNVLFKTVDTPPLSRSELDFTDTEVEILGCVNGRKPIQEIAEATGLEKLEVLKVLFGFYNLGLIFVCGEDEGNHKDEADRTLKEMTAKWEEIQSQNYYQIFGLDQEAKETDVKTGYFRFTKSYHPDKSFRYTDQKILDLMLQIFLCGKEAYEVLSYSESRKEYDAFLLQHGKESTTEDFQKHIKPNIEVGNIIKAEESFNRGKALLFSGRAGDALEFFEKALALVPDEPDYNAYTGLALARMKKDYKQSKTLIRNALETQPGNADYHSFLGEAHLRHGKKKKAETSFAEALKINPRHIQARREYQRLRS